MTIKNKYSMYFLTVVFIQLKKLQTMMLMSLKDHRKFACVEFVSIDKNKDKYNDL